MDLLQEWMHPASDCISINLLRPSSTPGKPQRAFEESFPPKFTYWFLPDQDEQIIGYSEPKITLDFRANDLKPSISIKYKKKEDFSQMLGKKQADIDAAFTELFPPSAFDPSAPSETVGPDPTSRDWKPPGKQMQSFELHGKQYEIWSASLADPVALEIWRNMQTLPLFFIEGATFIELDEDWTFERWTLHLLYEVTPLKESSLSSISPYTLAGFSTSHRYWIFPSLEVLRATKSLPSPPASSNGDASTPKLPRVELAEEQDRETRLFKVDWDPLGAPSRERISQFVILPPYQGQSLGARLYDTIFTHYVKQQNVYEIPVEDPSEDFDAMRDYSDIVYLRKLPNFQALSIVPNLPPESLRKDSPIPRDLILGNGIDLTELRHEAKIVPRQFNRMVELHLLSTIPPLHRSKARISRKAKSPNENDRKYYFWRLAIKDRIYRQNADVLDQMKDDPEQRIESIENAVDSQQDEYEDRLKGLIKRQKWASGDSEGARSIITKRKRAIVDDEEDDWEDEDEESVSSKKAKV